MPDNPFWYKRNNPYDNIGGTVADTVGDAFQARYNPRQELLGTSQYHTSRLPPTMEDQKFRPALSRETTLKIEELNRLVYKYRHYQNSDPDEIVKWAILLFH
jgi:hypothetical protein